MLWATRTKPRQKVAGVVWRIHEMSSEIRDAGFPSRLITGRVALWKAFWLVGCIGCVVVTVGSIFLIDLASKSSESRALLAVLAIVLGYLPTAYAVFAGIGIWSCSKNTKLQPLGALAQVLVVFAALSWLLLKLRLL